VRVLLATLLAFGLCTMASEAAAKNETRYRPREERTSDADAHRILGLEDQFARGVPRRDRALFERLLAPGFVYTENDQMMGRDEMLRALTQGTDRVTEAHNEGMRVHAYGGTVIVTGWLMVRGQGQSGRFQHRYRFTDTWMRRGEDWQLVAAHDYLVPTRSR